MVRGQGRRLTQRYNLWVIIERIEPNALIREARTAAGLTQAQLARRLGTSQPAVVKLERPGANPTVRTLDRVLRATGHRLELAAPTWSPGVDESLIREQLEVARRIRAESGDH